MLTRHSCVIMDATLRKVYHDPRNPGGLGGISKLLRAVKKDAETQIKLDDVKKWMAGEDTYTLHAPVSKHFARNRVLVSGIDVQFQSDLVDMSAYAEENDGVRYLLTCIDVFSKYAWVRPLMNKTGRSVTKAFKDILDEGRVPRRLQTDEGKEYYNKSFQDLMCARNITHFSTANETKCALVERYNRTIKTVMWRYLTSINSRRYIDALQDMVTGYNNTYHRSIKMTPASVNKDNEKAVFNTLYKTRQTKFPVFKFNVGDTVRISKYRGVFRKGYEQTFTDEIFTVVECVGRSPAVYRLRDYAGEDIRGTFYEKELQRVIVGKRKVFKIEKILKSKKRKGVKYLFVKWLGWPVKFNSWVCEKQVSDI